VGIPDPNGFASAATLHPPKNIGGLGKVQKGAWLRGAGQAKSARFGGIVDSRLDMSRHNVKIAIV